MRVALKHSIIVINIDKGKQNRKYDTKIVRNNSQKCESYDADERLIDRFRVYLGGS